MVITDTMSAGVTWNARAKAGFIILAVLPNILGAINIPVAEGFKLHLFQVAVFLAAAIYGPVGGLTSGLAGSVYAAFVTGNPYLVIGNAILGFFTGLFLRQGFHFLLAVLFAFLLQMPWLILTDYYLMGLPAPFIKSLVIALSLSNTVWALAAWMLNKPAKRYIS